MKKLYLFILFVYLFEFNYSQVIFSLQIGNKWFYQAGSNRNDCYGIIKEITDSSDNGFMEVTCKSLYLDHEEIKKECWTYNSGNYYYNSSPSIYNATMICNSHLNKDSSKIYPGWDSYYWNLINYQIIGITDLAQRYIAQWVIICFIVREL